MSNALNEAVQLHKGGHLDRAELIYRQILDDDPDHPEALHLLGVITHQRGQPKKAVRFIRRAVAVRPNVPLYHSNLAEAYRVLGDLAQAVAHGETAVRLEPHHADAHNHLGLALQGQGKLAEAVASFRTAVELRPDFALARNNLGSALREQGQADDALREFREAVRVQPSLSLAHSNLGQLLLETNQPDDALTHCREAVRLHPDFPEGLSNLGNVLRARDDLAGAKDCYRRALALRPNLAMAHSNLGQALQEEGNLDDSIACYRRSLELEPRSARVECYLAGALLEKELPAEAIPHYRRALEYEPDRAEAHNGLGHLLQEQGDFAGAVACFERALQLKPDLADAHANLGGALAEQGDLDRAEACYREALRHDPDYAGAYGVLATHLRGKLPAADVDAMHRFLEREHLSEWKRALLHHGLAHVYDAKGDFGRAADHAARANEYRRAVWVRQGKTYDRQEHAGFVSFLMKQFSPAFFERVRGWGLESERPVFVVGLPRSGTTLLEQILASHPRVFGAGELTFVKDSFDSVPALLGSSDPPSVCVPRMTREVVQRVGRVHLDRLNQLDATAARVVDKMPDNYLWLGFLAAVFPRAKFVYSRRDVRDVAVSCWVTNFKQIRWACDPDDIAGRVVNHQRIMAHWRAVLPVPVLEVAYEDVVADLEGTARRLLDYCGLEWDARCLAFHETKRAVRTASLSQVRQPIYTGSKERWRKYEPALGSLFRQIEAAG